VSRDPGDEDDSRDRTERCPFCSAKMGYRNQWCVAIRSSIEERKSWLTEFDACQAASLTNYKDEVLRTCLGCRETALRFARDHSRYPEEKEARAWLFWRQRNRGAA
jgi:hypothetical protein